MCNRLRAVSVSPRATGFGWTPLFDRKGQFFPSLYSWCGAFGPNVHTWTNKLKPACIWTGWGLQETQKTILDTQCINHSHQGEGDPKRRVQWCLLPEPGVDVTPRSKSDPDPCLTVFQEKGAPDDSCLPFYTACKAHNDIHWWCKDHVIEHHMSSQTSSVGTNGGKQVAGSWAHSQTSGTQVCYATKWKS